MIISIQIPDDYVDLAYSHYDFSPFKQTEMSDEEKQQLIISQISDELSSRYDEWKIKDATKEIIQNMVPSKDQFLGTKSIQTTLSKIG
jgi:hypothetical protein